ncbi:MAG: hypothetical protein ACFWTJ_05290 [Lachnoclostridium sp.]|jgi:transcription elongation factor GreA
MGGTEFLIYGLEPEWIKSHPDMLGWSVEEQYRQIHAAGGFVVHAHPFRMRSYIKEIRLFPDSVDAVEVYNVGNRSVESDSKASEYAKKHNLPGTAGTDAHGFEPSRSGLMAEKKTILTYEGLRKLEEELHDLKVNKRKEVAQKIKEAREQGDLSENAEYDAAKDEQREIEARIEEINKILKNVEVVVEDEVDVNVINIGCKVRILDIEMNEELTYKIVGSTEANSLKGKISNESPLGKALLGKKVGDIVDVETHGEVIQYKILEIQRSN